MAAAFRAAHVAVVASIEPEAFGRAATEAQVMATPVIATDIGAPPETVLGRPRRLGASRPRAGWCRRPIRRVSPTRMAEALAMTPDERARMGARARAHVLERLLARGDEAADAAGLRRACSARKLARARPEPPAAARLLRRLALCRGRSCRSAIAAPSAIALLDDDLRIAPAARTRRCARPASSTSSRCRASPGAWRASSRRCRGARPRRVAQLSANGPPK